MIDAMQRITTSLAGKMLIGIMAVVLVAGLSVVFIGGFMNNRLLMEQIAMHDRELTAIGESVIGHVMIEHNSEGDFEHLRVILRSIFKNQLHSELSIFKNDQSLAFGLSNEKGESISFEQFSFPVDNESDTTYAQFEDGIRYHYLIKAIPNAIECHQCHDPEPPIRGYFVTRTIVGAAGSHNWMTNSILTIWLLATVGLLILFIIKVLILNPLSGLEGQVKHIVADYDSSEVNEQKPLPFLAIPGRHDEIRDVTVTFNTLFARLNDATASVQELHSARLERADRLATTGEMAASLAHEIRNPLAGVMGAMGIIRGRLESTDELSPIIGEMMVQLNRIDKTVSDLLSYARPSLPEPVKADLVALVEKNLILLEQQGMYGGIEIVRKYSDKPLIISADKKMIKQVIWNIAYNSMQAMKSKGKLTIALREDGSNIHLEIVDTGGGISSEHLDSIFEPFYTTKAQGTGLGLPICKRIIEQHNGEILIESTTGIGTSVHIIIPKYGEA